MEAGNARIFKHPGAGMRRGTFRRQGYGAVVRGQYASWKCTRPRKEFLGIPIGITYNSQTETENLKTNITCAEQNIALSDSVEDVHFLR